MSDPIQAFSKAVEQALRQHAYDIKQGGDIHHLFALAYIQVSAAEMLDRVIANYNAEHGFDMADFGGLRGDIKALAQELRGTDVTE